MLCLGGSRRPALHSLGCPSWASLAGGSLLQSSAPVNIPGSLGSSASFHSASPSPPVSLSSHFLQQPQGHLSQSENAFLGTSASHGSLGKRVVWLSETWGRNTDFGKCLRPPWPQLEAVQSGAQGRDSGCGGESGLLICDYLSCVNLDGGRPLCLGFSCCKVGVMAALTS